MMNQIRGGDPTPIRRTALRDMNSIKDQGHRENAHDIDNRPTKRMRMSASPKNSQPSGAATIVLDNPNDKPAKRAPSRRSDLQDKFGYEPSPTEISSVRRARVKDTPLRRVDKQDGHLRSPRRSPSPDPLLGSPDMFTKNARAQRLQDEEDVCPPSGMRHQPGTVVTTNTHPSSRSGHHRLNGKSPTRKAASAKTPSTSRMVDRLREGGESPDALQAEFQTIRKVHKSRVQPLSSTDYTEHVGRPFDLRTFVAPGFLAVTESKLEVIEADKTFAIRWKSKQPHKDALSTSVSLSKIGLLVLPDSEENNIVRANLSAGVYPENCCYFEFSSRKTYVEFCTLLHELGLGIKTLQKRCESLQKVMSSVWVKTRENLHEQEINIQHADHPDGGQSPLAFRELKQVQKRTRKVDQLDAPPTQPVGVHLHDLTPRTRDDNTSTKPETTTAASDAMHGTRQTRSQGKQPQWEETSTPPSQTKVPARRQGTPWKVPLTYPLTGKGKETVTWDDLERLEDDQFLNDTLVSLFLKYLQKHSNPDWLKTMHYFNTFFYETLTRPTDGKGSRRRINYQGVSSWTKHNNIFQRDYVIVPVNEDYHWYVMIICNLRKFWDRHHGREEDHDEMATSVPPPVEIVDEPSKQILESDLIPVSERTKEKASDEEEEATPNSERRTPGRRRSHRVPGQKKFDTKEPVIITLDSLNVGRSGTAGTLKDYIIEEAKTKWHITISKEEIPNMTAKAIPLQNNFSDCGLYMCMYLEQFMKNPEVFKQSILQREIELIKWPRKIESGVLRQRLYNMLQELHDVQIEKKKEAEVPELGNILIRNEDFQRRADTARVTALGMAHEDINHRLDWLDRHTAERDRETKTSTQPLSEYRPDFIDVEEDNNTSQINSIKQTFTNAHEPVAIEDDSQDIVEVTKTKSNANLEDLRRRRAQTTSRHFPVSVEDEDRLPLQPIVIDHCQVTQQVPDSPEKLARRLAARRSPQRNVPSPSTFTTTENQERTELFRHQRDLSHASVTTEFLVGDGSYINGTHQRTPEETGQNHPHESEWNGFDSDVQVLDPNRRSGQDDTEQKEVFIAESIFDDDEDDFDGAAAPPEHTDMLMTN